MKSAAFAASAALLAAASVAAAIDVRVGFENGDQGWSIQNAVTILPDGGNPGAHLAHFQIDTFGVNIANSTSREFIGNYADKGPVRVGLDILVNRIWMEFAGDVPRDLIVELRDYQNVPEGYPWVSVWYNLGTLTSNTPWETRSVEIADPTSVTMPAGWGGTGAEDPVTFEPRLPANRTFADVLASVDEIVFTTFVPGFFFGFTNFDIGVDNVFIQSLSGCPADFNADGQVDFFDYLDFSNAYAADEPSADFNSDGQVDFFDYLDFAGAFGSPCE
ncbi:MAG: GC-type dockerin domain-anchored protein [Planctomycetota bacterium]|nr:GC-type dockerin domain-anchored protein [Planctomycetota bacterium]